MSKGKKKQKQSSGNRNTFLLTLELKNIDKSQKICYNKIENKKEIKSLPKNFLKKSQKGLTNQKRFAIIKTR